MKGGYSSAKKLHQLRAMLGAGASLSVYDVMDRLKVSRHTALRYFASLEEAGEPLAEEMDGKVKRFRLMPTARHATVRLSTSQMIALVLSRKVVDVFEGTGFKEDLDEVFEELASTLRSTDVDAATNLDRKLVVVGEGRRKYGGRMDDVDEAITALLREERIDVVHETVERGQKRFVFEPYTLLVYRGGLYFAGRSEHHGAVRTFALDGFVAIERRRKERFTYPPSFDPTSLVGDAWGIIRGQPVHVAIRFDERVAKYVRRRRWHRTQRLEEEPGGVVLHVDVEGTTELVSWVLGWGASAEVREPEKLRREVQEEAARLVTRYAGG
jgi:predicted DNA-binding transcriptional regulator YafY